MQYADKKKQSSLFQKLYVKFVDVIRIFKYGAGLYEDITKLQLKNYLQKNKPDGEIVFLAADPDCKICIASCIRKNRKGEKNLSAYG